MYSQSAFHHEIGRDRQRQLLRSAGADHPAAPHMAQLAASRRAELAADERPARTMALSSFAWFTSRLSSSPSPRLHGV
jgi:hypothetical protein